MLCSLIHYETANAIILFIISAIYSATSFAQTESPPPNNHGAHSLPHAFLIPNGVAPKKGAYNFQIDPFLEQRSDSTSILDIGGHASVGMFDWGGIHLRSLGARTTPSLKVIAMGSLYRDPQGESGMGLLGIVGVPTGAVKESNTHHGLSYLVGISGRFLAMTKLASDVILHYDVTAAHFIPELGLVYWALDRLFFILDARATIGAGQSDILPGFKYKISEETFIGAGYRQPFGNSSFDRQLHLLLELGRH